MRHVLVSLLAVVALVGATASSCSLTPTGTGKSCDTTTVEPLVSPDHPESIEAITHSYCDHAPMSHRVSLYIEELTAVGTWDAVPGPDLNRYTVCEEVPGPGHDTGCTRLVPCLDGTYRARYTVYGSGETASGDVDTFSWEDMSDPAEIRCPA